jgi:hypothetical protein
METSGEIQLRNRAMEADHSALGSVGQTAKNGNESDSNLTGMRSYSMEQTGG